jgi:hypothetical protein
MSWKLKLVEFAISLGGEWARKRFAKRQSPEPVSPVAQPSTPTKDAPGSSDCLDVHDSK